MPDRVKGAVFNILAVRYGCPGNLPALSVADVFAGSGSLGLEALSRGAARCCFFERSPEAVATLRANLDDLRVGPEASINRCDAWHHAPVDSEGDPFGLVFLDPPYRDSLDVTADGYVRKYLQRLARLDGISPLVVLHHRADVTFEPGPADPGGRQGRSAIVDVRTFGTSAITFFEP